MKKQILLLLAITCLNNQTETQTTWQADERYFDTTTLSDAHKIKDILIKEENFQEVTFPSSDNLQIEGLARFVDNPAFSIILCSGFLPGKQHGMASFVNMLPKNCNIIMYNARGKGKSEGKRDLYNVWSYGSKEYQDVIGAMNFVCTHSKAPLFVLGTCAGSFHALHATARVDQSTYNIKGIIVDSGMTSIKTMSQTALDGIIKKHVKRPWIQTIALYAIHMLRICIYNPFIRWAQQMKLSHIINNITAPIFYIHAHDDELAPFEKIKKLAAKTPHAHHWWIEKPSTHACNHLKHKKEYQEHMMRFINEHKQSDEQDNSSTKINTIEN